MMMIIDTPVLNNKTMLIKMMMIDTQALVLDNWMLMTIMMKMLMIMMLDTPYLDNNMVMRMMMFP